MRFKKLRISVGIALIIAILITANIIMIGKLGDDEYQKPITRTDQELNLADPKVIVPEPIIEDTSQDQEAVAENISTPAEVPKSVKVPSKYVPAKPNPAPAPEPVAPPPVIVHETVKTRAS